MGPNGLQPNVAPVPFVLGRLLVRKCARVNQGALRSLPAQRWAGGLNLVEVAPPALANYLWTEIATRFQTQKRCPSLL
jgi:hypothetical protein